MKGAQDEQIRKDDPLRSADRSCAGVPCRHENDLPRLPGPHPGHRHDRQEYWSGLPCPSLGDLPNPGIDPVLPETHPSILAWRFLWTEEPGGLQSPDWCLGTLGTFWNLS